MKYPNNIAIYAYKSNETSLLYPLAKPMPTLASATFI